MGNEKGGGRKQRLHGRATGMKLGSRNTLSSLNPTCPHPLGLLHLPLLPSAVPGVGLSPLARTLQGGAISPVFFSNVTAEINDSLVVFVFVF